MMFQIPSYPLMPQTQVSSPHLPDPPLSAHHLPPPQVTPLHVSNPQATSPHLFPQTQATCPYLPQAHVTSPHHSQPHVTGSHLLSHSQVTSPLFPHPYTTSTNFVLQPQVTSPHIVAQPHITSPHILSPPQYHIYNQNHDPGLDHSSWSRAEPPSELSYLLKSDSYSYQNQHTAHLDLHLQNENQFSTGVIHQQDELENTHRLSYPTHRPLTTLYEQCDTSGPVQDTWRPPGPTLPQLQCSPQGSMSGEVALGRWSSVDFSSLPAEESSSTQFYHNSAPQPFCSPTTPGPSPHYPQTPTISSPLMHPREERLDFHTQTSGQLSSDKTFSFCLHEYDSYHMIPDLDQPHPHQTSQHLFLSQSELIQDQTGVLDTAGNSESCFSPQVRSQEVSSTVQSPGLPAGLSWREECGGGGGGGGGGRQEGGNGQPDWTRKKQPQPKNSTKVLDRLLCTVCKRDFRSLPALNGHMRSHSGSRSATSLNKSEDPSLLVPPSISMVIPVTVPVQSSGPAKVCRSRQRRCSHPFPTTGHAVLYRSLLHQETAVGGDREVTGGDGVSGVHYTPPPMLCPHRAGPGLYCSLTTGRQQRVQTVQLHNKHDDRVAMETASPPPGTLMTRINKPRINVGWGFQAEIPPLRGRTYAHSDSHNALQLWTMPDELEHPVNQQRVEALVMMARSSVVPGGGASPETALHVLSECRGDFLLTVKKLLSTPETANNNHTAQQYKSVSWSAAERRLLVKSLQLQHKDFSRIQKAVKTKSLSQCVEFYYLWKKKLNLHVSTPAGLTVTLPETNGKRSSKVT